MNKTTRFSQNFLRDPQLVRKLLTKTNISADDIVYDIGGGKGIITSALAEKCRTVISVEIDTQLASKLRQNLQGQTNVVVYEADFLAMPLPQTPYKVFANIPFNLSSAIVHKLTDTPHPPTTAYLIVQKEFADKVVPKERGPNSQLAIMLGARFELRTIENLHAADFYPRPKVSAALIEIAQRPEPLIADNLYPLFRDFVAYTYNAFRPNVAAALSGIFSAVEFERIAKVLQCPTDVRPTQLNLSQWLRLFEFGLQKRSALEALVLGHEKKLALRHGKHTKWHRTRPDRH